MAPLHAPTLRVLTETVRHAHQSASGPKRTALVVPHRSAFGGKADVALALRQRSLSPRSLRTNLCVRYTSLRHYGLRLENFVCVSTPSAIRPNTRPYAGLLCTTTREFCLHIHSLRHTPKYAAVRWTALYYDQRILFAYALPPPTSNVKYCIYCSFSLRDSLVPISARETRN
jgi:hypothetical protein